MPVAPEEKHIVAKMEEDIEMVKTRRITFREVPSLEDRKDNMVSETEVITRELTTQRTIIRRVIKYCKI